VGIGTLIVFIALVLVAAIAAGVLINTADLLQSQAQQTGEESTEQVTNNLNVVSVTGTSPSGGSDNDGTVTDIDIRVQRAPGAGDIDLSQGEIQAIGPAGTDTYVPSGTLASDSDRVTISINLDGDLGSAFEDGPDTATAVLKPDQEAQLIITTGSGGQTNLQVSFDSPFDTATEAVDL
jgi:flagellin FlaB